jgi:ATP-dependent helicase/nuclease subunit B
MGRLRLLLGRTGTGKSTYIAQRIKEEIEQSPLGGKLFWIVPTALSFATERKLLEAVPTSLRAEVVHLHRLAGRANADLACGPLDPVNATGRRLLLAEVFEQVSGRLQVLHRVAPSVAFLDAVLAVFDEMSQQRVSLEHVEAALETAATSLAAWNDEYAALSGQSLLGKLRDLCVLYVAWKQALQTRDLHNPADLYEMVRPHLHRWNALAGARLFVDGFSDMTESELEFVLDMAECAEETVIALCLDPAWVGRSRVPVTAPQVFAPQAARLYGRIVEGCRKRQLPIERQVFPGRAAHLPSGIDGLERHLFGAPAPVPLAGDGIHVAAAQNRRVEADGVARELRRLHHERTVPFADMLVLVPDVSEYAPYLREAFHRYDIPHYMEEFSALAEHPLAKFLLAALQCVEENFSLSAVIRLLKNDFCGLSRDDADWLETYSRQYEVAGPNLWLADSAWQFASSLREPGSADADSSEDQRADRLRRQVAAFLQPLYQQLCRETCTAKELAQALWQLLQAVGAKKTVAEWMVSEDAALSPVEASLHEQAWQRIMGLLNDLWTTVPDTPLQRAFLFSVVKHDIASQTLASIPAGLDEVLVTDYSRALGVQAPVVVVMGAADGVLPRRWRSHGLLSDEERVQFHRLFGQPLGATAEERQLAERFVVYSVLTRATERLYLTYPLSDSEGKEIRPAAVVGQIRNLFQDGVERETLWTSSTVEQADDFAWLAPKAALDALVQSLRGDREENRLQPEVLAAHYRWWMEDDARRSQLLNALAGLVHKTAATPLPPATAEALFGRPLRLNAYQLESFAACPFQHFVTFGLKLQEDVTPDVTAAARGTVVHDALSGFIARHGQDVERWRTLSDEEAVASMREVFDDVLSSPKTRMWSQRAVRRYQSREIWNVLERAAVVLTRHARYGTFSPVAAEVAFGGDSDRDLPGMEVSFGNGAVAVLRGRIDRIDAIQGPDGELMFRIIDYKSSHLDLDLSEVEYGLRLQLPIYAAVVERFSERLFGRTAQPVGLVYLPIVRKTVLRKAPLAESAAEQDSIKQMRARGWLLSDRDVLEAMDRRLVQGEDSELFQKVYKKDGSVAKNAPVLEAADWRRLLDTALERVRQCAERIATGDVSIAPYQWPSGEGACRTCSFARVCQIDRRWDPAPIRHLKSLSADDVLLRWRSREQPGEGGNVHEG